MFKYDNIDFDAKNEDKEWIVEIFDKIIPFFNRIYIFYIYVEDENYAEIITEKSDDIFDVMDQIYDELGIETSLSDEDYGDEEHINVYLE